MGLIQESDVGRVLADQSFMDQIVAGLLESPSTMDTLADDVADKLGDALENDSELRQKLLSAAVSNEAFKRKLVSKLIDDME